MSSDPGFASGMDRGQVTAIFVSTGRSGPLTRVAQIAFQASSLIAERLGRGADQPDGHRGRLRLYDARVAETVAAAADTRAVVTEPVLLIETAALDTLVGEMFLIGDVLVRGQDRRTGGVAGSRLDFGAPVSAFGGVRAEVISGGTIREGDRLRDVCQGAATRTGVDQWQTRVDASTVTYMEMRTPPRDPARGSSIEDALVRRIGKPTPSFYRYLYTSVGGPWAWTSRSQLPDAELSALIHSDVGEIHVIFVGGVPAGYAEFDLRRPPDIELAYFGLSPEFIGRGLGALLLDWSIREVWRRHAPRRLWLHTRALDHPRAIRIYRNAGFVRYDPEERGEAPGYPSAGASGSLEV